MTSQSQQKEYLASISQAFDVGDFDYLSPGEMQTLNQLIAAGWSALKSDADVDDQIDAIEKFIHGQR